MINLRFILISSLLCISLSGFANFGAGFSTGYRFGIPKWNTFNQFKKSYSNYYQNEIQDGFSGFGSGRGFAINSDLTVNGFVFGVRYSQFQTSDQVRFKTGGTRHFEARQSLLAIAMGFGYQGEKGHAQFTLAMLAGTDRIGSYYGYTDGTKSVAGERGLNGKYDATRLGWSARAEFSVLFFYAGIEYVLGKSTNFSLPLDDAHTESNGIPTDYGSWVADPYSYDLDQYVRPDLNGLRFEIGLRLNLADE